MNPIVSFSTIVYQTVSRQRTSSILSFYVGVDGKDDLRLKVSPVSDDLRTKEEKDVGSKKGT